MDAELAGKEGDQEPHAPKGQQEIPVSAAQCPSRSLPGIHGPKGPVQEEKVPQPQQKGPQRHSSKRPGPLRTRPVNVSLLRHRTPSFSRQDAKTPSFQKPTLIHLRQSATSADPFHLSSLRLCVPAREH